MPSGSAENAKATIPEAPVPPWQLWPADPVAHPGIAAASSFERQGQIDLAIKSYRDIELREPPGRDREDAFARRIGALLKMGRSRNALEQITVHLKEERRTTAEISPILALLAAFSYEHQQDVDQTFAWLGVAHKRAQGQGIVARRATNEAIRITRSLPTDRFNAAATVWGSDPLVGPIVAEERIRRSHGGAPEPFAGPEWFRPETYGATRGGTEVREADLAPTDVLPDTSGNTVVGVLLPESGKYAEQARSVKSGIELARETSGVTVSLLYADTATSDDGALSEYQKFVRQGAAVVLGPLLVRDAERVAESSKSAHVPFITFTKRPGITELSPMAFRLGATAENQVVEVVRYAAEELHHEKFAILLPAEDAGADEFRKAYGEAVRKMGVSSVGEVLFRGRDEESVRSAVERLTALKPDAIFVGDEIERAVPVLKGLQTSSLSHVTLLGPAVWNDPVALRGYSGVIEGAVFATPYYASSDKPVVTEFVEKYRRRFGGDPDLLAAQAYDVANLVFQQVKLGANSNSSKLNADELMHRLAGADTMIGVTGKLTVGKNRDISRRMSVVRMYRGETVEVMNGGSVTGFLPNEPSKEEKGT